MCLCDGDGVHYYAIIISKPTLGDVRFCYILVELIIISVSSHHRHGKCVLSSKNEDDLKNVDNLKNEDDLKNGDNLKNKDNLKNEDDLKKAGDLRNKDDLKKDNDLKIEDNLILKTVPGLSLHNLSVCC